jgi:cysteinyl-tRNA synthetase
MTRYDLPSGTGRQQVDGMQIILRGRQRHLYEDFVERHRYITPSVLETVVTAYREYMRKNLPLIDQERPPPPHEFQKVVNQVYGRVLQGQALHGDGKPGDDEAKIKMHIKTLANAVEAVMGDLKLYTPIRYSEFLHDAESPVLTPGPRFYELVQDIMCPMLDDAFSATIKGDDYAIWSKLTREFENRFFRDVRELNVMDPEELVRVTEYGAEIAEFVDKIVKNKFAYSTSDGSVYFDVKAFEAAGNPYARLEPWNRGNEVLYADGEGKLTQKTNEKRSPADFALWKSSKTGEPSWPSPWGPGRPGWHIECSAMASAKLGKQMDIHSGGIDLAFPHHDNELAQSEAYWSEGNHEQWVNYFLHMGHLSIQGSKMSKSLKNFTTIRTALERGDWTPRSLRIVFLLGNWRDGIEITDDLVAAGSGWEDKVDNFFLNVKDAASARLAFELGTDQSLGAELKDVEEKVYDALCDSFNTPAVMALISSLISKYNSADKQLLPPADILATARFVTKMVNIFGLNGPASPNSEEIGWRGIEIPEDAKPYVYPLSSMRDELREAARSGDGVTKQGAEDIVAKHTIDTAEVSRVARPYAKVLSDFGRSVIAVSSSRTDPNSDPTKEHRSKELLALCDRVRDIDLWKLNIYLEDRDNAPALVRPVTATLAAARQEREARAAAKEAERARRKQEEAAKMEKGKLSHLEMYKPPNEDAYEAWDEDGMPTREKGGEVLTKSRLKKLRKDWERQKKAHEAWLAVQRNQEVNESGQGSASDA